MAAAVDVDQELDELLTERAREAAARWQARQPVREQRRSAAAEGRSLDADSRPRVALWLNRLINEVRTSSRDRGPERLPERLVHEAIDPGEFSIRQKRIGEVERLLDTSFGPVAGWDKTPPPSPTESLEDGIEIESVSDIVFSNGGRAKTARK